MTGVKVAKGSRRATILLAISLQAVNGAHPVTQRRKWRGGAVIRTHIGSSSKKPKDHHHMRVALLEKKRVGQKYLVCQIQESMDREYVGAKVDRSPG
ncbi:hypothetical protein PHYBLDRAFT_141184 [Phycomyces blakesleeanus NRRL 1555(-)]|uniref:Uncharacterized protein n=1 Tax=Phycomyces blakesleeanus (strain ATCC 8743b / DSM 1359 / FGSC 10004 / NBRC 33097 / NRRL 1555) TaxID=763407 RepID=A0A167P5Q7_PHYB8|nr:hypothetical protein PHYBLDRAFT_141184 [Phycomyces blakesleeanus NRRL 1555(-)]OAD77298.1 hypothetical protein PHYBLDRAFT_141184 [Phycomyces blakesleeanus NRRL 1555(-)]|eukprot:XP_018295338.1 hypothetical protein PHYBLDRAFT_141184 [Phycomyces blakesleeanus NRRL 1555(-)]